MVKTDFEINSQRVFVHIVFLFTFFSRGTMVPPLVMKATLVLASAPSSCVTIADD
jgi:hypothetical protein